MASTGTVVSAGKTHPDAVLGVGRRLRLAGLLIVLSVAVLPLLFASIRIFLVGEQPSSGAVLYYRYANSVLMQLTSLALLLYVLRQNGQTIRDFGLEFRSADARRSLLLDTLLLAFGGRLAYRVAYIVIVRFYQSALGHTPKPPYIPSYIPPAALGLSVLTIVFVIVNPLFEELIVRCFLISEVTALTGSSVFAVGLSVVLQTTYHLYQGVPNALAFGGAFLIFSIYYVKRGRIIPIVLAHLWFDVLGAIVYPLLRGRHL